MVLKLFGVFVILAQFSVAQSFIKQRCRGTWSMWGRWKGKCTNECSGVRVRHRACVNTGLFYCGAPQCSGSKVQYDVCSGDKVNGQWSEWSTPDCHYCNQKRMRTRKCNNPAPKCGGSDCKGPSVDIMFCGVDPCPSLGNLIADAKDYRCGAVVTVTCPRCHKLEGPTKLKCLPDGEWNKKPPACTPLEGVDAQWSAFGAWSSHCKACNQVISRTRKCRSRCGEVCQGKSTETYVCGSSGCSINSFVSRSKNLVSSKEVAGCGETVRMSCKNGKTLLGSSRVTCGLGGWRNSLPDCVDQTCPSLPVFENGKVMSTGLTYGKFSHFTCNTGYEIVGQQYLVCLGTQWSYGFPTCKKKVVECKEIELTNHMLINSTNLEVGSIVSLYCDPGYQLLGQGVLICEETLDWNYDVPRNCVKKRCPAFPEISNAIVVHSDGGKLINISCERGFQLEGAATVICELGVWDNDPPVCKPSICELPHTDNGKWYRVMGRNIALLRCNRGYTIKGNSELVCGTDNSWERSEKGVCELHTCQPLSISTNGAISSNDTNVGSVVTFTCQDGYEVAGHWELECLETGEWNYDVPQCKQSDCTVLQPIANGYISTQHFFQGSIVSVVCEQGYKLKGESSVVCLPTGHWSASLPECELYGCVKPVIENGSVSQDIIPIGQTVRIKCDTGFTIRGSANVMCNKYGKIELDPISICLPVTCNLLTVENGNVILDDVVFGSVAHVKCRYGYQLHNRHDQPMCLGSGNWSFIPHCQKTLCSTYPDVTNGYLEGDNYEVGAVATVVCNLWHVSKQHNHVTCLETGEWSTRDLKCIRNSCGVLEHPINGRLTSHVGGGIQLFCDKGYKVKGTSVIRCDDGIWNGTIPECIPDIQCPALDAPYAGYLSTNSTEYLTHVHVTCHSEHILSSEFPVVCNSSGMWNSSLPSCSFPNCPDVTGSGVILTGTKIGDTARLECGSCQKKSGNKHSVCKSGGIWEPPIGQCKPVTCNTKINRKLYESVEGEIPTKCGKSVTFMCKPGFTTIGRTTVTCYDTGQYDYHVPFCVQSGIFKVRRLKK